MAQKEKKNNTDEVAKQLGMTAEQLTHARQQAAAARGRGRRPAGTAGADTKLAGWGQVDGQAQLFATGQQGGDAA
jgi:transposase-like protein